MARGSSLVCLAVMFCFAPAGPQAGEPGRIVPRATLENSKVRIDFASGGVLQIRNKAGVTDCLTGDTPAPVFAIGVKPLRPSALRRLSANDAVLTDFKSDGSQLTARYVLLEGRLVVTCRANLDRDEQTHFRIGIINRSDLEVAEVEYPLLQGVRIGPDAASNTLILPGVWGQIWRNPAATKRLPQRALAMRWLDVYNDSAGLYVGSHDGQFLDTEVDTPRSEDGKSIGISCKKFVRVAPGGSWNSDDFVIAPHPGDWHWGADCYRAWALTWRRPLPHPEWVDECDGWHAASFTPFSLLPHQLRKAQALGLNYVQTWGEMSELVDPSGTFLFPSPLLGSIDELRESIDEIHLNGGHITFYCNSQLWDPGHSTRPYIGCLPKSLLPKDVPVPTVAWYRQNAIAGYDGLISDGNGLKTMCAAATGWQEHLRYWTDQYVRVYGADGIYFDQMGCVNNLCARLDHGHSDYGTWQRGSAGSLSAMVRTNRLTNPGFTTSIEGCNDVLGQYADFQLASGVEHEAEIYRYTFPEDILIDGYSNGGVRPAFGGEISGYNRIFLLGERFDGVPDTEFGRRMMALRRATRQLLYPARFMDDVGLHIRMPQGSIVAEHAPSGLEGAKPDRDVDAKYFSLRGARTQALLVNVVNAKGIADVKIAVPSLQLGPFRAAYAFDGDGKVVRIPFVANEKDRQIVFTAPVANQSTVLLVCRCEPLLRLEPPPGGAPGERTSIRVNVLNVNDMPLRGTLAVHNKAGWKVEPVEFGPIAPGDSEDIELHVPIPSDAAPGSMGTRVEVSALGEKTSRYVELPVLPPLTVRLQQSGDEIKAVFENRSANKITVRAHVDASPGLAAEPAALAVELPAGAVQERLLRLPRLHARHEMAQVVVRTDRGQVRTLSVAPALLNGGFETGSGNGLATYWNISYPPGNAGVRLDQSTAAEGVQSLRLEPLGIPNHYVRNGYTNLKPDTLYRMRVKIRRSAATDEIWAAIYAYPKETMMVSLGKTPSGSVGQWEEFEGTFRTFAGSSSAHQYLVYCYNGSKNATAWFDDIRIEPSAVTKEGL